MRSKGLRFAAFAHNPEFRQLPQQGKIQSRTDPEFHIRIGLRRAKALRAARKLASFEFPQALHRFRILLAPGWPPHPSLRHPKKSKKNPAGEPL
jgi:hypothetical protein